MQADEGVPAHDGAPRERESELRSEWVYRLLLILYPQEHRREYGEQMVQLFRDRLRRDGGGFRTTIVWFRILSDLLHSALNEHLERSGLWRIVRSLLLPLFSRRSSIHKAQTREEVAGSLLIPWLVPAIFTGVAVAASPFVADTDRFREMFVNTGVISLMATTTVLPLLTGMTFRLRHRYDLRSVLLAIIIYWPIYAFAIASLYHSIFVLLNGELLFAISDGSLFFAPYGATVFCILPVLMCLSGSSRVPAPAIAAHRYFQRAELGLCLIAVIGIGIMLLLVE